MNKEKLKGIVIGGISIFAITGIVYGAAQLTGVYTSPFAIKLNGNTYQAEMPVLNYQNRTYLALRELGTVLGDNIDFQNNTIIIDNAEHWNVSYEYEKANYESLGGGIVNNVRNIPNIYSEKDPAAASKVKAYLLEDSSKVWDSIISASKEYADGTLDYDVGVDYIINVAKTATNYIAFSTKMSGSMGGVSWDDNKVYTFDMITGNILQPEDIFNDYYTNKDAIAQKVTNQIKSERDTEYFEEGWEETVITDMFEEGRWSFTESGVLIAFERYSIASGAEGVIEVTVKLNEYLKDSYKI